MMSPVEYGVLLEAYYKAMQAVVDAGGCVQLKLLTNEVYRVVCIGGYDDILWVKLVDASSRSFDVRLSPGWGFMVSLPDR